MQPVYKTFYHYYILIPLLAFLILAGGCADDELETIRAYDDMKDRPSEVTRDATIIYSDSAQIKARMHAPLMQRYRRDKNELVLPEGLNLVFYDPYPSESAHVKSDYGIRYIEEKITELKYNVVVVNVDGDTLETEHLIWEEEKERIYSEKLVKVTTPSEVIIGQGFESDPSFTEYTFYEIKGTLQVEN